MITQILVALDLSQYNESVFQQALDLAKGTKASLTLLHVPNSDDPECPSLPVLLNVDYHPVSLPTMSTMEIYEELWKAYSDRGLKMLEQFATMARASGVATDSQQVLGSPGKTICALACQLDSDLIVLGRRGHSGWTELLAGSVSNYVMHHAPCSVLIAQHPTHPRALDKTATEQKELSLSA
jgi:nucleotide-binding universal stress UspA family protein